MGAVGQANATNNEDETMSTWTNEQNEAILAFADARGGIVSFDDVEALRASGAEIDLKTPRQVIAKLSRMDRDNLLTYRRKATAKRPRSDDGQVLTKPIMVEAIAQALDIEASTLAGLEKAGVAALQALHDAVCNA